MSEIITPTTELEAVNECLANIRQSPVSSIVGSIGVDAKLALGYVRSVTREMQARGWHWNTELNYPLTPNFEGHLILPANTLSVDSTGDSADRDVIQRGRLLYDRTNRTFIFTDAKFYVEMVLGLPFDELPETARRYIALRAARIFQDRVDEGGAQSDVQDELVAMTILEADQLRNEDNNMLTSSYITQRILNRNAF